MHEYELKTTNEQLWQISPDNFPMHIAKFATQPPYPEKRKGDLGDRMSTTIAAGRL